MRVKKEEPFPIDKPTLQLYPELQEAYDHFNKRLFQIILGVTLRECIIVINNDKPNTKGYHARGIYINKDLEVCDEISLNSRFWGIQSIEESLSTLAHEMAHLYREQTRKKEAKNSSWHDMEWSKAMNAIGLKPISYDFPGKEIGQKVHHKIIHGGPYEIAARELIDKNYELTWKHRYALFGQFLILEKQREEERESKPNEEAEDEEEFAISPGVQIVTQEEKEKTKSGVRVKYQCNCDPPKNVWGKGDLNILCLDCDGVFSPALSPSLSR